jgi:hypothetical protein
MGGYGPKRLGFSLVDGCFCAADLLAIWSKIERDSFNGFML